MQDVANATPQDPASSISDQTKAAIPSWQLPVILFGAPLAWLIQMWLSEPIAAHACFPRTRNLDHPVMDHLALTLTGIGVAALIVALACNQVAWRARRRILQHSSRPHARRFLIEMGLCAGVASSIATVFTLAAALIVSPCGPW